MKPVRPGDRGPAVEDIQRRLLILGYQLGPTGIDGVFLGRTRDAVVAFQKERQLDEDGIVGDETWAALVDASFTLGDRVLYLRLPHFHGHDVFVLQQALNALGFACGAHDGIFGAYTERAVREFQQNSGLNADGIVGDDTARAVLNLRHVWEGKEAGAHSAARTSAARSCDALTRHDVVLLCADVHAAEVAERALNLSLANTAASRLRVADASGGDAAMGARLVVLLVGDGSLSRETNAVRLHGSRDDTNDAFAQAVAGTAALPARVVVDLGRGEAADEAAVQGSAVRLLDAICGALD